MFFEMSCLIVLETASEIQIFDQNQQNNQEIIVIFERLNTLLRDAVINTIAASSLIPFELRFLIYRFYGIKTKTKRISPGCFFGGHNVNIELGTFINYRCFFDNSGAIEIGENCSIGMEVMFCTSSHEIGKSEKRAGKELGLPIKLGQGCWIGTRVIILPGVTIGDGCIIAAGSVVTHGCDSNGLYAGIPAKLVKKLFT